MDKQNFDTTVNSLFSGMDHVLSSKTVVGEPQVIGDTIILPLVDISFGMGAGAFNKEKGSSAGGGIGGKMSPSAILVIHNGQTKLVNIRDQDAITKVIDMAPDFINKFLGGKPAVSEETVQTAKDTAAAYDTGKAEHMDVK